jgi:hypothetical protein
MNGAKISHLILMKFFVYIIPNIYVALFIARSYF